MITGATGNLGGQTLQFVLERADSKNVSAIARNPSRLASFVERGVQVTKADYDDKQSLVKAFRGTELLYFVSGNDVFRRLIQHENVVSAAKEAGVTHVVYTSLQCRNETESSPVMPIASVHLQTEKWLKESGLKYTILKNNLYTEFIPVFTGPDVLDRGMIYLPAGDGRISYASRTDMAEAFAMILTTEGHENKIYGISGTRSYSYADIAGILSDVSGKAIAYASPTMTEFKETLSAGGVPDDIIGFLGMFGEGTRQGEFDLPDPTLENLLGHKLRPVEDFLKDWVQSKADNPYRS